MAWQTTGRIRECSNGRKNFPSALRKVRVNSQGGRSANSRIRIQPIRVFLILTSRLIAYFVRVNVSIVAAEMIKSFGCDIGIVGTTMSMFGLGHMLPKVS
jgi:hypothetical protein